MGHWPWVDRRSVRTPRVSWARQQSATAAARALVARSAPFLGMRHRRIILRWCHRARAADYDKNGYATGSPPYSGDYVLPGERVASRNTGLGEKQRL